MSDSRPIALPAPKLPLTRKEEEAVRHLLTGRPYKVIAHQLGVTESTVKVHAKRALAKYRLRTRAEMMHAFAEYRARAATSALELIAQGAPDPVTVARVALEQLQEVPA